MKSLLNRLAAFALLASFLAFGAGAASAQDMAHPEHTMTAGHGTKANAALAAPAEVTVIDLTQRPGTFTTEHLDLAAGQYQFRVSNDGVGHDVGFVIQRAADKDGDLAATALPTSFVTAPVATGATESTGIVTLAPGEYVYSCPLNPTPHYTITVK